MASSLRAAKSTQFVYTPSHASSMRDADFTLTHQGEDQHVWCIWTSTVEFRKEASAAHSKITCLSSPTALLPQDKHTLWDLSTRVLVCAQRHASRAAAPRVATGSGGTQGAEEDETSFSSGVATGQMRTCYGSHDKYAFRKPSHRISRDHRFYKHRPANKTDHLCQSWQYCHTFMKFRQSIT